MTGQSPIDLSTDHKQIVLEILRTHLPQGIQAWVFGSRATGRARLYSDLDLAIDVGRRLMIDERARLTEAFSDSNLPYRVDVVDCQDLDDRWRAVIEAERISLIDAHTSPDLGGPGPVTRS
jgi:predicted nucleotidyltransferase